MSQTLSTIETYECFGIIGRGSLSTIYDGYDHELKRDIVIKELRPEFREDADLVETFWGEATVLAGLNHANILRVYGVDRDRFWIVMEPMQTNLASECGKAGLAAPRVREILKQVLEGIRYLHSLDRCYGRLRLGSLLVDTQGSIKLSGISESGNDGEFRCPDEKNLHCAPEILNPKHFGQPGLNADLYSVGILALQLIAGEKFIKLFKGMDRKRQNEPIAWSAWHASSEPIASVQSIVPDIPADLVSLIDGLTQKQPGLRFATAPEALGMICSQAGSSASFDRSGLQQTNDDGVQATVDGATVVYNSPNLFSPTAARRADNETVLWKTLLSEASRRLSPLRNPKAIAALVSTIVGLFLLLIMLIPAEPLPVDVKTAQPEQKPEENVATQEIDFDYNFGSITNQEIEPARDARGSVKLILMKKERITERNNDLGELIVNGHSYPWRKVDGSSDTLGQESELSRDAVEWESKEGPITLTLRPETHDIRIKIPGYQLEQRLITCKAGEPRTEVIELIAQKHKVIFTCEPPGMELRLLGTDEVRGRGEQRYVELLPGTHIVKATAEGCKDRLVRLEVASDLVQPIVLDPLPEVATVIESFPNGADVRINGIAVGRTPFTWSGPEGKHQIEMKMAGFEPIKSTFRLSPETETNVPLRCWYLEPTKNALVAHQNRLD